MRARMFASLFYRLISSWDTDSLSSVTAVFTIQLVSFDA
jgi:hypothetical protein